MTFKFIAAISSLVLAFPLVVSVCRFNKLTPAVKVVAIHIFIATLFEVVSRWLWMHKQNNLFLLHLYTLWELEIILLFYWKLLPGRFIKRLILASMAAFAAFTWVDAFYLDGLAHFNSYARPVACILVMCYTLYYLYRRLIDIKPISIMKDSIMLINAAFLFYFSLSFFLFLLSNYMLQDTSRTRAVWAMHTATALIFYTSIGWALWKDGRE